MNQLLAMRAFVRVVETESFSRAADQLGIPRSTVSKLVTDLEAHLRVKLIHRTTRTVAATTDGLAYLVHARRIVNDVDSVDNALSGNTLKPHGHLRIDAPASFATSLLIPALPDFHRQYPDITVAIGISDRTLNVLGEGVDCAIRAGQLDDLSLVARQVSALPFVTCAAPDYLATHGIPEDPEQLAEGHRLVAYFFPASGKLEGLAFQQGEQSHTFSTAAFTTNEGNGLTALLLAGMGIGQHLKAVLQPHLDSGKLVEILPGWTKPALPLHAVYPPNRNQSARLMVFVEWLQRTFGQGT
ncbi:MULTISPECIES: LysR family transcriptional regulator [Stenotrophomonas]|uniref:LysR substrate-binding domain-containing protein n=1 Tax=Stenotrophomonas TaxID=40323 RepID=UPI0026E55A64|nr:LysR family transcriptional regulator [Stenotrophomonas sp. 704A1]